MKSSGRPSNSYTHIVTGDIFCKNGRVIVPVIKVQLPRNSKPSNMICRVGNDKALDKFILANRKSDEDCDWFSECLGDTVKNDWRNFVCSEKCPHNKTMDKAV